MIEITTTALVLFSAIYGNPQAVTENSATASPVKQDTVISANLEDYTRNYFKDTPILAEIAKCESRFNQFDKDGKPIRGRINKADVGIMQINEYYHLENSKKAQMDIYTLEGNLKYGKLIYSKYGTAPWSASQKCWGSFAAKSNDLAKK